MGKKIDTVGKYSPICPWCGYVDLDCDELDPGRSKFDCECFGCGKEYRLQVQRFDTLYTTTKKEAKADGN